MNTSSPRGFTRWPRPLALASLLALTLPLHAAIPSAAMSDPRYALGYLVVTHYSGVDPTGSADSTAGIQQAIEDSKGSNLAVFFPPGTYKISNTLELYSWQLYKNGAVQNSPTTGSTALVGSKLGTSRPKILLASGASGFNNTSKAKPMVAARNFEAEGSSGTAPVAVANAFEEPTGFDFLSGNSFNWNICNLDFDCNGNTGAVGVAFDGAQYATIQNVKVIATGAIAGFVDLGGPGGTANIEVVGGNFGVVMGQAAGIPGNWTSVVTPIVGMRLTGQTVASLVADNYNGPVVVTGFYIEPGSGAATIQQTNSLATTSRGTFILMDGVVNMDNNSSAWAIDNVREKSIMLRNVFVKTTNNLVRAGTSYTTTGSGTWKQIVDYVYTDQRNPSGAPNYTSGASQFETYNIINGNLTRTAEHKTVVNNVTAPSADELIARHLWMDLPSFEDGATGGATVGVFENPITYGATPETSTAAFDGPHEGTADDGSADSDAIQDAIDAASAAGHGRVMLPRGVLHLDKKITLRANTKLFGASLQASVLAVHASWLPTSTVVMIDTDDDRNATTYLGFMSVSIRRIRGTATGSPLTYPYDRFAHLDWKAGRNSMTVNWRPAQEWVTPSYGTHPRYTMKFTGSGGGRHYTYASPGRGTGGTEYRAIHFVGTTEPTWFYTTNVEATKGGTPLSETNIEIDGASNIRLIGLKREGGPVPTAIISNSNNVALYGHELYETPDANGDLQILGTSDNIVVGISVARGKLDPNNAPLFREAITGQSSWTINWPHAVSLYRRGTLNDELMFLPSPWLTADIGAVGAAGNASYAPSTGTFTLVGSGANIYAASDEFRFMHREWTGDLTVVARVTAVGNTNAYAKAGIMIRKSFADTSAHATINVTPNGRVEFLRRTADGNSTTDNTYVTDATLPKWLKLVRSGSSVDAYYSNNGTSWTQLGSTASVTFGSGAVHTGLVACAANDGALSTSTFTDVSVSNVGASIGQDVGAPALAGSSSLNSGVYTVNGAGADIYHSADQFHFVHQPWTGDGRLLTRVTAVENTDAYAKGGLMIRDDLTTGSRHVMQTLLATAGVQLLHRGTANSTTTSDALVSGYTAPTWLRLERRGTTFTGWHSLDGLSWYLTGSATTTLNSGTNVGLAVTSHDAADMNTSTFDNFTVASLPTFTAGDIGSGVVTGSTSVNYATDVATINAGGVNIWGTADSFHFYRMPWTTGDVTLVAEITTVENTSTYAKTGVMIRQSLNADSIQATAAISYNNGAEFLRRTSTGGTTTNSNTTGIAAPRWVKLVRSGNNFSAYQSADGYTWTQIGATQSITMTGTVYVGLASCSIINTTNLCTSTVESFYVN